VRRRRVIAPRRSANTSGQSTESDPPPVPSPVDITACPTALAALGQLLRGRAFRARVASSSDCEFVRFSGTVFARCAVSDECPDGVPEEMRAFQDDACFVIVDVPPGLVARALASQSSRRSSAATAAFASHLSSLHAPVCAVYERHGLDESELSNEQETAEKSDEELEIQLQAWFDIASSRRLETDVFSTSGASLFEESSHLLDL
jgi:hypothetical protein